MDKGMVNGFLVIVVFVVAFMLSRWMKKFDRKKKEVLDAYFPMLLNVLDGAKIIRGGVIGVEIFPFKIVRSEKVVGRYKGREVICSFVENPFLWGEVRKSSPLVKMKVKNILTPKSSVSKYSNPTNSTELRKEWLFFTGVFSSQVKGFNAHLNIFSKDYTIKVLEELTKAAEIVESKVEKAV